MQRFNLALLPVDESLQPLFREIAQRYFKHCQDGYILADGALAHVTLCQFYAESARVARDVFIGFSGKKNKELLVQDFDVRVGEGKHRGFLWAAYLVEKKASLLSMQSDCFAHLAANGIESLVAVEGYLPHITLARIKPEPENAFRVENAPGKQPIAFRPTVGLSTENGLFVREL
ncbi:MAG: hypothetical protein P4M13_01810 [Alphaproteobacteria bacterium]|nr:hypothetical protein [Alphaproteobacteria bacterium]